jgi:hypothetical protein
MKYVKNLSDYLVEKSIGSEEIRIKWYSGIDKKIFYKIVNIDPTSVRKVKNHPTYGQREFSKPGKYVKWLLIRLKRGDFNMPWLSIPNLLDDDEFCKKLNYYLFIYSTNWTKNKIKASNQIDYLDIMKFKSISDFISFIGKIVTEYETKTEKSKFDLIYSDTKIDIMVPLNFSASYETAKNTDWCTQTLPGFNMWSKMSILYRIIPKDDQYDKLKLTWRHSGGWNMACSKYPEIGESGSPFEKRGRDVELWEFIIDLYLSNDDVVESKKRKYEEIKKTMSIVSNEAKISIEKHRESQRTKIS